MSRARKLKKAAKGNPTVARIDRMFDKRWESDPTFLIGQGQLPAPIKTSRCKVCVGNPHHSPWLLKGEW